MKQKPPAFQFYPRQWMADKAVLAMDWDAQAMHLWLMGIAWQSTPPCRIPNEEQLIRMWLKNPDESTWQRVWPQIKRGWKISGTFLKQSGLIREHKKIRKFSDRQTEKAQKRWKRRRKEDDATAMPRQSHGNARAGNALQSSSAEAEEDKKKSAALAPLGGGAPLPGKCPERQRMGHVNGAGRTAQILEDDQPEYGHKDFLAIGQRDTDWPTTPFGWDHLEGSLSDVERVQSKMREKFYNERKNSVGLSAHATPADDVF